MRPVLHGRALNEILCTRTHDQASFSRVFIQAGAQAPERLRIVVSNAALEPEPLDLSTVTAVSFLVVTPRGDRRVWAAAITAQSASALTTEHVFEINDVYAGGSYQIDLQLTTPDGIRRAGPTALQVIE